MPCDAVIQQSLQIKTAGLLLEKNPTVAKAIEALRARLAEITEKRMIVNTFENAMTIQDCYAELVITVTTDGEVNLQLDSYTQRHQAAIEAELTKVTGAISRKMLRCSATS